jgi:hypothetical protein
MRRRLNASDPRALADATYRRSRLMTGCWSERPETRHECRRCGERCRRKARRSCEPGLPTLAATGCNRSNCANWLSPSNVRFSLLSPWNCHSASGKTQSIVRLQRDVSFGTTVERAAEIRIHRRVAGRGRGVFLPPQRHRGSRDTFAFYHPSHNGWAGRSKTGKPLILVRT